jgi:hypothetical protein
MDVSKVYIIDFEMRSILALKTNFWCVIKGFRQICSHDIQLSVLSKAAMAFPVHIDLI